MYYFKPVTDTRDRDLRIQQYYGLNIVFLCIELNDEYLSNRLIYETQYVSKISLLGNKSGQKHPSVLLPFR